jgi:SAM-dependent methyltransferase
MWRNAENGLFTKSSKEAMGIRDYYIFDGALSYEVDGEHTDTELTMAEMEILRSYLSTVRNSVHLCCGAGRHVSAFSSMDIYSVGMDISPYLIAKGQKNIIKKKLGNQASLILGEAYEAPFKLYSIDCVTMLGNSFSLFSNEKSLKLLKEIKQILRSNGIFIFDIPHPSYTASNLIKNYEISRNIKTNTLGEVIWGWTRKVGPSGKTLTSKERISYTDENGCQKVKNLLFKFFLYDPSEICSMASNVGLTLIKKVEFDDASGRYHGMLKKRIFFVLKAV